MKYYTYYLILALSTCSFVAGQELMDAKFIKVDNKIIPQKFNETLLKKSLDKTQKTHCLNYDCGGNSKISFCNDKSEDNYIEYQELGSIDDNKIIVVEKMTYNEELYIFINQKVCTQVTLIGFPLKIEKSNKYITYNNPSTDKQFKIQIVTIINGVITIKGEIFLPEYIKLKRLYRIENNEAYILDDKNQLWKTNISNS